MSQSARRPKALVALAAFGALVAAAPGQASAATTVRYGCDYPLVGSSSTQVTADLSDGLTLGLKSLPNEDFDDTASTMYQLIRAASVGGDVHATLRLVRPDGSVAEAPFDAHFTTVDTYTGRPVELSAHGALPSAVAGAGRLRLVGLDLNLSASKADGMAITQLSAAQQTPDSDGDPDTFDVICRPSSGIAPTIAGDSSIVDPEPDPTPTPTPPIPTPVVNTPAPTPVFTPTPPLTPTPPDTPTPPVGPQPEPGYVGVVGDFPLVGNAALSVKPVTDGHRLLLDTHTRSGAQDEGDSGSILFKLVKASSIDGYAIATVELTRPDGTTVEREVTTSVPLHAIPESSPLSLTSVSGELPAELTGAGTLRLTGLRYVLAAYRADGTALTQLSAAQVYPDSDGDPRSFDVPATITPGGQDTTVARGTIVAPTPGPTPTPTPRPTGTPVPSLPPTVTPVPPRTAVPTPTPPRTLTPTPSPTTTPAPGNGTLSLGYDLDYPLVGKAPAKVGIQLDGRTIKVGIQSATGENADDNAFVGLRLVKAASVDGQVVVSLKVTLDNGTSLDIDAPTTIATYAVPPSAPLAFTAQGTLPNITGFVKTIDVTGIALDLTARAADGRAITQLSAAQSYPDSDGDPSTFDVPGTLNPPSQSTTLVGGSVIVTPGTPAPTPPPTPTVTKTPVPAQTPTVTKTPTPTPVPTPGGTRTPTPTPEPSPTPTSHGTLPPEPDATIPYGLNGQATLRTLTRGSVPLSGGVTIAFFQDGSIQASELQFAQSTAKLTALGFLPVQARVQFVPQGPVEATRPGGTGLGLSTKARIKVPQLSLFGIQLYRGAACQTKGLTTLTVKSAAFSPVAGTTSLTGTFAIGDLAGCGALSGLISPLTAGPGNAIALKMAIQG